MLIGLQLEQRLISIARHFPPAIRNPLSLAYAKLRAGAYRKWIKTYEIISAPLRSSMAADIPTWRSHPLISVIMPSYNIAPKWMSKAIESVRGQIYPHWELCISDDASTLSGVRLLLERYAEQDPRIRVSFRSENGHISANSNAALALAKGDYIALLDADDLLSEDALFWMAREISMHPEVDLLFSDEDKIDHQGKRSTPYFKPAWNAALMLSQNAFSHLGVYRRRLVEEIGGFRKGYEGSQDHDLVLRCAEKTDIDRIRHIPRVLYHWRMIPSSAAAGVSVKPYAWDAGRRAVADHLKRVGIKAHVKFSLSSNYEVEYDLPGTTPLITIIVPTTFSNPTTVGCLGSVLTKSSYKNFELLILAHSENTRTARNNGALAQVFAHPRVRVVEYEEQPFNFSRVSNLGARCARGRLLCFLNDDVQVITPEWLERLVARATLDGVGTVGAMLYYPNNTIQHAGIILGAGGVVDHAFRDRLRGDAGYFGRAGIEQDYSCVTAACMAIDRKVFESVGGFDETLPAAFNDIDLCLKLRRADMRIIWTPSVEMYHHESLTLGSKDSPARQKQFLRDIEIIRERWGDMLGVDPCYNPNLSLLHGFMFSLAWPPRIHDIERLLSQREGLSRTSRLIPS